jgi:uncharacterized membrane protein YqjE
MASRRALLRHLWAMVQTRAEAATLVAKLQRTAVTQALMMSGIAAVAAMSFVTALIVLIAVAAPPSWRVPALCGVTAALLATAIYAALTARRKLTRDAGVIADFTKGLKLDLAMINLALKDADADDEAAMHGKQKAKEAVREAAAEKSATPSTAEGGREPTAGGPAHDAAQAAMQAAAPSETDIPKSRDRHSSNVDEAAHQPPPVATPASSSPRFATTSLDARTDATTRDRGAGARYASAITEREAVNGVAATRPDDITTPAPHAEREAARHGKS